MGVKYVFVFADWSLLFFLCRRFFLFFPEFFLSTSFCQKLNQKLCLCCLWSIQTYEFYNFSDFEFYFQTSTFEISFSFFFFNDHWIFQHCYTDDSMLYYCCCYVDDSSKLIDFQLFWLWFFLSFILRLKLLKLFSFFFFIHDSIQERVPMA